jgi:hypothetical protein
LCRQWGNGAGAIDDKDHPALFGGLTTVDDAGVGDMAHRKASMEMMSAIRLTVPEQC